MFRMQGSAHLPAARVADTAAKARSWRRLGWQPRGRVPAQPVPGSPGKVPWASLVWGRQRYSG